MHGGKLSHAHINKYHQGLILLSQFVRQTNRGSFTVETERLEQTRALPEILTTAEVKELYNACDADVLGLRDKVMLDIFYPCGLRRNEGVHLDVSDIDFKGKLLYVRKGKNYKERYVPVNDTVLQHIKDYLDHSRPFLQKKDKTPALFISDKGYRAQGQSLLIRLRKLARVARIGKRIGLHTLRHSIATHLLQGGMNLKHIARFLDTNRWSQRRSIPISSMKDFKEYLIQKQFSASTVRIYENGVKELIEWIIKHHYQEENIRYADLMSYIKHSQRRGNAQ